MVSINSTFSLDIFHLKHVVLSVNYISVPWFWSNKYFFVFWINKIVIYFTVSTEWNKSAKMTQLKLINSKYNLNITNRSKIISSTTIGQMSVFFVCHSGELWPEKEWRKACFMELMAISYVALLKWYHFWSPFFYR